MSEGWRQVSEGCRQLQFEAWNQCVHWFAQLHDPSRININVLLEAEEANPYGPEANDDNNLRTWREETDDAAPL